MTENSNNSYFAHESVIWTGFGGKGWFLSPWVLPPWALAGVPPRLGLESCEVQFICFSGAWVGKPQTAEG